MNVCIGFFMVATAINLFCTFCLVCECDMNAAETIAFFLAMEVIVALIVFGCGLISDFR